MNTETLGAVRKALTDARSMLAYLYHREYIRTDDGRPFEPMRRTVYETLGSVERAERLLKAEISATPQQPGTEEAH